jgi:rod shape determining protein RodA
MTVGLGARGGEMTIMQKLGQVNWGLILLIMTVATIGFAALYSAAEGSLEPWAGRQMIRFSVGLLLMLAVAVVDLRFWFRYAYTLYAIGIALLVAVIVVGTIGMGAQRWLELGPFQIQPSELMKIAMVLVLARYFHGLPLEEIARPWRLIWPTLLVLVPAVLVFKQPKLGSAVVLAATGGIIFFMAGVRVWKFMLIIASAMAAVPVAWSLLRDYQKQRILTFLDPETDPLGAGYHIIQSKIALGSGGLWGKGYMQGTQSHLQFLPEKQTDFIFTMFSEEFGFVGGLVLIGLYALILIYGTAIAVRARNQFGRLVAIGLLASVYLNAFINMAMVMGLLPVVGEPLPLVSYGGTAMLTLLVSFGLIINVYVHRDLPVGRRGLGE